MGRHLDLDCPKCRFHFQVGARKDDSEDASSVEELQSFVCPSCGYSISLRQEALRGQTYAFYNGDRILVSKLAYDFAQPRRWDVFVFKFPDDAKVNYIKRLIGLPNEVLRVREGDINISHDGGKTFDFPSRDPAKLRAMLLTVYDNDFIYLPFMQAGWPARWHDASAGAGAVWQNPTSTGQPDPKVFTIRPAAGPASATSIAWLRYTHFMPSTSDWNQFNEQRPFLPPQPKSITDFLAYDSGDGSAHRQGQAVVDDLAVECTVDVEAAHGKLVLELLKREGHAYQCVLDLTNGTAEMIIPDQPAAQRPKAGSGCISRAGTYRLALANVDRHLTLWVDDRPIEFDRSTSYPYATTAANQQDFVNSPVGIGSQDAAVQVSHLRVLRDIYYTYVDNPLTRPNYDPSQVPRNWPQPETWNCFPTEKYQQLIAAGTDVRTRDQYYFPRSRPVLRERRQQPLELRQPLLAERAFRRSAAAGVGKSTVLSFGPIRLRTAIRIFGHDIPLPFWPNFSRMRFVR